MRASIVFSVIMLPLLAGMMVFILLRRPRQPVTWGFVGALAGLIIFYGGDLALYWPGLSWRAGLVWQLILNQGPNLVILSALWLLWLFREQHLERWEWMVIAFILVRMVVDFIWLAPKAGADAPNPCTIIQGLPRIVCPEHARLSNATAMASALLLLVLYIHTTLKASPSLRPILRRYIVWIVLLMVTGSTILQISVLTRDEPWGLFPTQPFVLIAAVIGIRMFLALEELETGVRLSQAGRGLLAWLILLILALTADLTAPWLDAPIATVVVMVVGIGAGGAVLLNELVKRAQHHQAQAEPSRPATEADRAGEAEPPWPLRLYLLGGFRAVRQGEALPNTSEVWRSAKTRSLLAYLALRAPRGATQTEIVDALWPLQDELNPEEERRSRSAFRSYLATLRRVLEPNAAHGSERFIELEGGRYRLRPEVAWVDVWEFQRLMAEGEALWAGGRRSEAAAAWEAALALYPPEGLLPDELYLPPEFLEPVREDLRFRWLRAVGRLVNFYAEQGNAARAEELRRLWQQVRSG
ncbi:MAG: hypothetical protein NZ528_10890 [Caldilineales bacterium]|nr:hypothetical protein [Caldilineales bacterium]MDW8316793.1 hypothetical protein [Anaerolineae bacterium]